ncbi:very short patch repair endonuclease [Dyella japonica]|uniref:very short patch repair endonuclease n=1 Tax=Dyella japonica TaxID=231455 RepID=UPI0003698849|nr:very short patch repair endonuclease [Dyella japonica]
MGEKISHETRSRMMSGIRARDTKPEKLIRSHLHAKGLRFRLCVRDLPGKPDIVLAKWRVVVLVHGCFWHGHVGCRYFRLPKTRAAFWAEKISKNAQRDAVSLASLLELGWRVAVVWECALRDNQLHTLDQLSEFVRSEDGLIELASPLTST